MTSNQAHNCYIYITLSGQINPITAGRFSYSEDRHGVTTGRFIYGKSYLNRKDAVELDPLELKLGAQIYETVNLNGIFGTLRDAGPDYWGRRMIERHLGQAQISEMDYLLNSPDDRAGALGFGHGQTPPAPKRNFNKTLQLKKLQDIADAIIRDEDVPGSNQGQIEDLIMAGTSMGGARPKAVIEDEDGLHLAKFNRFDDKWNNALVEHAMLNLARYCGINSAISKTLQIGDKDVLLVRRFDRNKIDTGYCRARMISALTALKAEDSHRSRDKWSYIILAEELRRISSHPAADAAELFKRMCFNAMISNIDDHPRNHAFIATNHDWRLSPAYDLTPAVPISIERRDLAMACGDNGRFANAANLISQCGRFLLEKEQATKIINDMEQNISQNWYKTLKEAGVTNKDCDLLKGAFLYQGFRFPLATSH